LSCLLCGLIFFLRFFDTAMGNEHDDEDNSHDVVYFCTSLLRKEGGGALYSRYLLLSYF
jgi:hypothetical protein